MSPMLTHISSTLSLFKDKISKEMFDMTMTEAKIRGLCVSCKKDIKQMELCSRDRKEWSISALCPTCFDEMTESKED
jgi:predicted amidophosphoribosyltransferase